MYFKRISAYSVISCSADFYNDDCSVMRRGRLHFNNNFGFSRTEKIYSTDHKFILVYIRDLRYNQIVLGSESLSYYKRFDEFPNLFFG